MIYYHGKTSNAEYEPRLHISNKNKDKIMPPMLFPLQIALKKREAG